MRRLLVLQRQAVVGAVALERADEWVASMAHLPADVASLVLSCLRAAEILSVAPSALAGADRAAPCYGRAPSPPP